MPANTLAATPLVTLIVRCVHAQPMPSLDGSPLQYGQRSLRSENPRDDVIDTRAPSALTVGNTMDTPHRMITQDGQYEFEVKKSRFICSLFRVDSEEEARAHIDALRKQYWDANHNCTAWVIGQGQKLQRSSDDGEPSGTAGVPMLEVLRRREMTDTLAVVTRYFGGVMLGAGGLIRAYGTAVSGAVDAIGIVDRKPLSVQTLVANYDDAGRIENAIRASDFPLTDVAYGNEVTFELVMEPGQIARFQHWIGELTNGAIISKDAGVRFKEVPTTTEAPDKN